MDELIKLRNDLTAERTAREQAEAETRKWQLSCGALTVLRQEDEARLAEAMDHIRWLQPMAKGWAHAHESIASNHRIVIAADEFLSSTTPPLILAERDALRVEYESRALWIEEMNKILGYDNSDGFHSEPSPHDLAKYLVAELAALKLKLEVASSNIKRIAHLAWRDEQFATADMLREALSQLNESGVQESTTGGALNGEDMNAVAYCQSADTKGTSQMDWQLRPMQTFGESDEPWDAWILFRTGDIKSPVAVIQDYEMKTLVSIYNEHEARKKKRNKPDTKGTT